MTKLHKDLNNGDIHIPFFRIYATATARAADTTVVQADVGKIALQQADNSLWLLTRVSPVSWVWIGGAIQAQQIQTGMLANASVTADKIADSAAMKLTGNQTARGVKTFPNGIVSNVTGNLNGNAASAENADKVDGSHGWEVQTLASGGSSHGPSNHVATIKHNVDGDGYFKLIIPNQRTKVDRANSAATADNATNATNATNAASAENADKVDGSHGWELQTLASGGSPHGASNHVATIKYNVDGDGYFKLIIPNRQTKVDRANSAATADAVSGVSACGQNGSNIVAPSGGGTWFCMVAYVTTNGAHGYRTGTYTSGGVIASDCRTLQENIAIRKS